MNIPNNIILGKKAIPMTADGEIISSKNYPDYYCVLEEERYCNGEGYWDDGNTEYVSRVYVDYNKAMERVKLIKSDHE